MRVAPAVVLSEEERGTLVRWSRGRSTPARLVVRAKIVMAAADGRENLDIAQELEKKNERLQPRAVVVPE